ncbi:hypothetical protein, variant [Verruconis gallopava]|uniref:DUF1996 domain-containing protein n=1 Tax=Verruconis gallopava TaxID=253628 RepID=A0A0D1XQN7_9PEZI|nr:uncharacterized protein PV09_04119 [Verruconis gallopava]XP_016214825.1 hypothetical protein, variant [Verruconis gallopava]KIW04955.1 hypothetical protein PV09_04119 [Verruconis gallopava]KIW04956.1 hypothetical protein, variant [Verruconis gallopava]
MNKMLQSVHWVLLVLYAIASAEPGKPDTSKCGSAPITMECCPDCYGTLPSVYTITAVKLDERDCDERVYNGLKVESFNLFMAKVASYCPFTGDQASLCPNGTDMALTGTLEPLAEVPGGQDMYVNADGLISITVQHSHFFPPGSYPYYEGWTWKPYRVFPPDKRLTAGCKRDNPEYNCDPPTGFFNFQAPNATVGGLRACPNEYEANVTSVYAVTPEFNRTDCVELDGLGTHVYTGPNPPVWAYF